ncbi:ATP-binding protein [Amycolatopsis rubida]|uniref:ATP-binding protein n=1 Tax=Amycolatopsis rubida TaxID=112413 RepID=A0ABX0BSN0_9PSEU|nr:AAA family ATPase [Amycolatopsis rubida]NEC58366.1 ATP-binding protein [Amycolatopsis rubida]
MRDPVELSLVASALRGATPPDGDWKRATTRVAGIYGANASGKSTILDAIGFMIEAISNSATSWSGKSNRLRFPFHPYLLDENSSKGTSTYDVDFVFDDVRYNYGFRSNAKGIHEEWLSSYPHGRPRSLFHRKGLTAPKFTFGRTFPGRHQLLMEMVRSNALYLSVGANANHPLLSKLADAITQRTYYAAFNENAKASRLKWIMHAVEDPQLLMEAESLLRLADLGISGIELRESSIDDSLKKRIIKVYEALNDGMDDQIDPPDLEVLLREISREIKFSHGTSSEGEAGFLSINQESSGTIAWLTIGVPAIHCLKNGDTLIVDEIDASLHPLLSSALIGMFKDEEINKLGAQLVFTSHDVSLIGKLTENSMSADEIWFIEKDRDGASQLYSLHEFEFRNGDNFEKRYLEGRYGAIPSLGVERVRSIIEKAAR